MNAVEIEEAVSRLAAEPFDPKTFPFAFLEAFRNTATAINRLKSGSSNGSSTSSSTADPVIKRTGIVSGPWQ